ncbi:MAG: hypothetical protein ACLFPD_04650 [Desulfosudaceae bacterium]
MIGQKDEARDALSRMNTNVFSRLMVVDENQRLVEGIAVTGYFTNFLDLRARHLERICCVAGGARGSGSNQLVKYLVKYPGQ